jgi:hypothetical protein
MKNQISKILVLLFLISNLTYADGELKLKDFKVDEISTCVATSLDMSSIIDKWEYSVTEMKKAVHGKPDFAGHYYLAILPTTAGGVYSYAVIDCLTGKQVASSSKTYTLDSELANPNGHEMLYLPSSRLLIMEATINDSSLANIYQTEYYEMKDGKLTLIKKSPAKLIK